jgi:Zn-dependent protease
MDPIGFVLLIPPLLFALTVHEWSHGYAALRLGDPTARLLGRLTLNPLAHLDPIGSILMLLPPHFGWAKPVPVDPRYLANPRRDLMWIALAGPLSNLLLAVGFGLLLQALARSGLVSGHPRLDAAGALALMLRLSVQLNLVLMTFNLIPIFPLDGSRILAGLLSPDLAERYRSFEPMGPFVLLGLVLLGPVAGVSPIGAVVSPVVYGLGSLVTGGLL